MKHLYLTSTGEKQLRGSNKVIIAKSTPLFVIGGLSASLIVKREESETGLHSIHTALILKSSS